MKLYEHTEKDYETMPAARRRPIPIPDRPQLDGLKLNY
jgi:hypothetical protein